MTKARTTNQGKDTDMKLTILMIRGLLAATASIFSPIASAAETELAPGVGFTCLGYGVEDPAGGGQCIGVFGMGGKSCVGIAEYHRNPDTSYDGMCHGEWV
jgi:hypothetical protein